MSHKYLAWVRTLPCVICQTDWDIQAHHEIGTKQRGVGMKVSDYRALPLCPDHHSELHQHGHVTWEIKYDLRQSDAVLDTLMQAIFEGRLVWQPK